MLFNKDDKGSLELKALIGFIYKSINFDNLKSYVGFAERDIKKIIGPEVFQTAQDHYDSDNYLLSTPDEDHPEYLVLDELVSRIQYPVAVHAYRKYVPSSDLTHSDKGRQIFVSEQEKPAFEWQIEKDNENLLRLAHESTDILLEFLDDHIDDIVTPVPLVEIIDGFDPEPEGDIGDELSDNSDNQLFGDTPTLLIPWKTSAAYLASRELFLNSVDEFQKYFIIQGSRLVFISLLPIMRRVQDNEIKSCFSAEKYAELLDQFIENELSTENIIILDKVRQPMALLTLSVAAKRLSAEILPDGIFSNMTTSVIKSKMPASKIDRNEVSASLERDAVRELRKLQDHLARLTAEEEGETLEETDLTAHIDADLKYVRL